MEYYSAMKRSDALTLATSWRDLEHMVLSERRQTQRPHRVCDSMYVTCPEQAHPETESGFMLVRGWEGDGEFLWG